MKTKRDPRHLRRVRLLKALYVQQFSPSLPFSLDKDESEIITDINQHAQEIDLEINKYAQKFSTERMAKLDLSILKLGIYELVFKKQAPSRVIVDECIELAKEFGATKSPSFVNGILGKLIEDKL